MLAVNLKGHRQIWSEYMSVCEGILYNIDVSSSGSPRSSSIRNTKWSSAEPWTPLLAAHSSHWVEPFVISQHGRHIPTGAAPLTTTLELHHGAETQKEILLAAPALCTMDSVSELWTWKFSTPTSVPTVSPNGLFSCHNSRCLCFLFGHRCCWGCWSASCH